MKKMMTIYIVISNNKVFGVYDSLELAREEASELTEYYIETKDI